MLRPHADPDNLQPADFLCNFCGRPWADDLPMIEGHRGSLICGRCLSVAYADVVLHKGGGAPADGADPESIPACVLCLEHRREPAWASPVHDDQRACARCLRQAATALSRDPDSGWTRPTA